MAMLEPVAITTLPATTFDLRKGKKPTLIQRSRWQTDTGATEHVSNDIIKFESYEECSDLALINTTNGLVRPKGVGTVIL